MARASPIAAASCIVLPRVPPAASSHLPLTQYRRPAPCAPGMASEPGAARASRSHALSTARRLLNSAKGARSSGLGHGLRMCGTITSRVSRSARCGGRGGGWGGAGTRAPPRSRLAMSTRNLPGRGPSPHSSSLDGHEHSAGARPHPSHGRTGIAELGLSPTGLWRRVDPARPFKRSANPRSLKSFGGRVPSSSCSFFSTEIGSREIGVALLVAHSGVLRAFGSRGSVVP